MRRLLLVTLVCALPAALHAQGPPQRPPQEVRTQADAVSHLGQLSFMLGTWKGSGWMMLGPGRRAEFTQTEVVSQKLGGSLITVEGDGRDAANPERHIHDAFATLSYTMEGFRWMAFNGGNMVQATPEIGDKRFTWGFEAPYGKTRFTLDFSGGQWHETGELSRDNGQTWTKNFEMTLSRQS